MDSGEASGRYLDAFLAAPSYLFTVLGFTNVGFLEFFHLATVVIALRTPPCVEVYMYDSRLQQRVVRCFYLPPATVAPGKVSRLYTRPQVRPHATLSET